MKVFLWLAVCSVCVFSAHAQMFKERESSIVLLEKTINALVLVENPSADFNGRISLEILDETGNVRARASENKRIKRGRETHKILFPTGDLLKNAGENIAWYRLNYRIADENENLQLPGSDWDFNFSEENGKTTVHISIYNESLERMERIMADGNFKLGTEAQLKNLEDLLANIKREPNTYL
jgi:hypothetical protein